MLSIGKLTAGSERYYLDTVAPGVRDYYLGDGEAPGRWTGAGAALLGLAGEVAADDLGAVLAGRDPGTGDPTLPPSGRRTVTGWDLTFSAPKSVSLLYGLGDEAVAGEVVAAHEAAVDAGLAYLERHAAFTRLRTGGVLDQLPGEGLAVAAFRHRTSRAGDPQLHTHCLAAAGIRTFDGRWGAIDARHLYASARTGGFVYQAVLRGELSTHLGVTWGEVRRGMAEVEGLPKAVLAEFSQRRNEIVERLAQRGQSSAAAAQRATLYTRRPKHDGPEPGLREEWAERAADAGLRPDAVERLLGPSPEAPTAEVLAEAAERLVGPAGLTAADSTFDRRGALRAWCEALPAGSPTSLEELEALADGLLLDDEVVALSETTARRVARSDGIEVDARPDRLRHSTCELLALEAALLEGAEGRRGEDVGKVAGPLVEAVLARRPALADEQSAMVRRLMGSGDGVEVVVGKAGAGKTFALDAARAAWSAAGHSVTGVALAARAAAELERQAGIPSTTVARFLGDLDRPEAALHRRSVVVVDEAGMVDTRRLAALLGHAERAGAKVVLVGDHRQLPEVEVGGAFRALAGRLGATTLVENRRQTEAWERDALDELREGDVGAAVAAYDQHQRLVLADDGDGAREAMVADWAAARADGKRVLMVALRNRDVADLNRRARSHLTEAGELVGEELASGERGYRRGDEVLCLRNDGRLGVHNGVTGRVADVDLADGGLVVELDGGRRIELPGWYLEEDLTHAYATTAHKAQGATVDRTLVLGGDQLYREAGYVALSRGRESNHVYLVAEEVTGEHQLVDVEKDREPIAALSVTLSRSAAKLMALDQLDDVQSIEQGLGL